MYPAPAAAAVSRLPDLFLRPQDQERRAKAAAAAAAEAASHQQRGRETAAAAVVEASGSGLSALTIGSRVIPLEEVSTQALPGHAGPSRPTGSSQPLHRAAKGGDVSRIRQLLEQGHDPTQPDERGRVPYQLCKDKEGRDEFRRAMARDPDRWDWKAAQVPSPLTDEMEAKQRAKQEQHRAKEKERRQQQQHQGGKGKGQAGAEAPEEDDEIQRILQELDREARCVDAGAKPIVLESSDATALVSQGKGWWEGRRQLGIRSFEGQGRGWRRQGGC